MIYSALINSINHRRSRISELSITYDLYPYYKVFIHEYQFELEASTLKIARLEL